MSDTPASMLHFVPNHTEQTISAELEPTEYIWTDSTPVTYQIDGTSSDPSDALLFMKLSDNATIPTREEHHAAWELYAAESATIVWGTLPTPIKTDIRIRIPQGHYARVAPKSGNALNKGIVVDAGVIDRDYYDNIIVLLHVCVKDAMVEIKKGDKVAQLIIEKNYTGPAYEAQHIGRLTKKEHKGFGSTGGGVQ